MAENAIDFETGRTLNGLVRRLGSLDECLRLGFVYQDEKGVMSPSAAGTAYLLYVVARDISDPAEAFAAGYEAAMELMAPEGGLSGTDDT
jgi:hypothetical protein